MTISTRFPRVSQPQEIPQIDWSNPLTHHLVRLVIWNLDKPYDLISKTYLSQTGTAVENRMTAKGLGKTNTVENTTYWTLPVSTETHTSVSVGWVGSTASSTAIIIRDTTSNTGNIFLWRVSNSFDLRVGGTDSTQGGVWETDKIYNVVSTSDGTSGKVYANGSLVVSGGVGAQAIVSPWNIHRNGTTGITGGINTSLLLAIWDFPLNVENVKKFSDNPWQLFAPIEKPIFSVIDFAKIRGPKPRQVVRTSQPGTHTGISNTSTTKALSFLWSPNSGSVDEVGNSTIKYPITSSRVLEDIVYIKTVRSGFDPNFMTVTSTTHNGRGSILIKGISLSLGGRLLNNGAVSAFIRHEATGVFVASVSSGIRVTSSNSVPINTPYTICVYGSDNNYNIWVNGVVTSTTPGTFGFFNSIDALAGGSGAGAADAKLAMVARWNRQLSVKEIELIAQNPWQLFANAEQPFWHTELVQPKKFFPVLALPVPKSITANSVTPQVTLSF